MRILNIAAALGGLTAMILLVYSSHGLAGEAADNVRLAALIQLISAVAALAVTRRAWRLDTIAGALILGGAFLFTLAVSTHAIGGTRVIVWLAPVGGVVIMLGWLVLAFARPKP